jgi:hypothetical protein
MPKAGPYEYPVRDLDNCIKYLKDAYTNKKRLSYGREEFGSQIGVSSKSGPFGGLVGAMNQYGLVETGRGQIQYTELARRIVEGQPDDAKDAKKNAALNINLFTQIYAKYGAQATEDQMKEFLKEQANLGDNDALEKAVEIRSIFRRVSRYFDFANGEKRQNNIDRESVKTNGKSQAEYEEYRLGEGIQLRLPREHLAEAWARTKKAIDALLDVQAQGDQN